jgi:hypothetical protein
MLRFVPRLEHEGDLLSLILLDVFHVALELFKHVQQPGASELAVDA